MVKNLPASVKETRGMGSIPGWERSLGGGNGNPLQYSCLESPMDRGVWQATVHGVAKSHTTERLSMHACTRMNQEAFSCKKWKRMAIDFQTIDYQSAIPEPITSASPGNLLEMQILHFYPGYTVRNSGGGPRNPCC